MGFQFRSICTLLLGSALFLPACSGPETKDANIGYVEADWIYIAAPEAGWIVSQPVQQGMQVEPGELLFQLDTTAQQAAVAEADARIRQSEAEARNIATGARAAEIRALEARLVEAEARATRAEADKARVLPLVNRGVQPQSRGDTVIAEADMAAASVAALKQDIVVAKQAARPAAQEAAEAATESAIAVSENATYRLRQRSVTARTAGRVADTFLEVGEYAMPGAPVLAILPDDGLKVRFFVPQAELPQITLGETVQVTTDGMGTPLTASISYIAVDAEFTPPVIYSENTRGKLVFLVEAQVPAGSELKPGLPVEIVW